MGLGKLVQHRKEKPAQEQVNTVLSPAVNNARQAFWPSSATAHEGQKARLAFRLTKARRQGWHFDFSLEKNALFVEFKGALTENLIAQLLIKNKSTKKLFYWSSGNTAEVDFIVSFENTILPLEVKAGESNKKKSLLVYDQKYHPELLNRTGLMNLKKDGKVCNYPLYLIERFPIM